MTACTAIARAATGAADAAGASPIVSAALAPRPLSRARRPVRLVLGLLAMLALLLAGPVLAAHADAVTYADVSDQAAQPYAYTEEGVGGTRVVTPHYAVFLEDGQFPDGFAYAYAEELHGAYGVLDVYAAASRTAEGEPAAAPVSGVPGQPAYRFYCVADGASDSPFAGAYATASFVADGTVVMVARPYGEGFAAADASAYSIAADTAASPRSAKALVDGADAAGAAESADAGSAGMFGSEDAQAAQDQAVAMAGHLSADTATRLVANADGSTSIVTPWYTVTIPYGLFPEGWYHSYSDAMYDWSGEGAAYGGRVLDVYAVGQGLAFSVYCGKDAGPQGEYAETRVAEFDGDWAGWHVGVFAPADAAAGAQGDALARLAPYAALVEPTDNPGMNPPDLS